MKKILIAAIMLVTVAPVLAKAQTDPCAIDISTATHSQLTACLISLINELIILEKEQIALQQTQPVVNSPVVTSTNPIAPALTDPILGSVTPTPVMPSFVGSGLGLVESNETSAMITVLPQIRNMTLLSDSDLTLTISCDTVNSRNDCSAFSPETIDITGLPTVTFDRLQANSSYYFTATASNSVGAASIYAGGDSTTN